MLEGLIVAFLNLDRVIDIIRYDEAPKPRSCARTGGRISSVPPPRPITSLPSTGQDGLSEVQADAILNMRLRSLRRLEEMALVKERDTLMEERAGLEDLLERRGPQWADLGPAQEGEEDLRPRPPGGRAAHRVRRGRRVPGHAGGGDDRPRTDNGRLFTMGWIRAMTGHIDLGRELKFKDGDGPRFIFHAETTDRLLVFGSNGRFYTISAVSLPGGRGMGEPLRLMVDLPNEAEIVALFIHRPGGKLLVASNAGDGFLVSEDEVVAQTRSGKQVLNLRGEARAQVCRRIEGDHVACVGENRKVLIFALEELPEMTRGKGVRLQKYRDGGLSDARTFRLADGLSWRDPAGRTRTETDLTEWLGKRATSGRMAPRGFPRDNRFT